MTRPLTPPRRRTLLHGAAAACLVAFAGCGTTPPAARAAGPARLRLLGEASLPHRLRFRDTTVGGLSAIDFDPASQGWVVLSDDRSVLQAARFYRLRLDPLAPRLALELQDVVVLRDAAGRPYPPPRAGGETVDPEGLRLLPGGGLLWTSEGHAGSRQDPALHQAGPDGSLRRSFTIPAELRFSARPGAGPRANKTLEGLALSPDARTAWVAMEGPLRQDGPPPTLQAAGGPCRFTAFDLATGRAVRQRAYQPDALPLAPLLPGTRADNGVSEILMLDAHRMLVLERAYALGTGVSLRLYEVDTREGSDTLGLAQLHPGRFEPLARQPVADFARLGLQALDNFEGMCWGPRLPGGGRSLVVVSDDNFNPLQATRFAAFEYLE